nr:hypothetical protein CFP56_78212 [Quercus suber]
MISTTTMIALPITASSIMTATTKAQASTTTTIPQPPLLVKQNSLNGVTMEPFTMEFYPKEEIKNSE